MRFLGRRRAAEVSTSFHWDSQETLEGGGVLPVLKRKVEEAKSRTSRDESGLRSPENRE